MLFIVLSNINKVDPSIRKLIRRHVMRGKKRKKADRSGAIGLTSTDSIQNHRTQPEIRLQDVIDMYALLQPGCFGVHRYFIDYPDEIEASILWNIEQGGWRGVAWRNYTL